MDDVGNLGIDGGRQLPDRSSQLTHLDHFCDLLHSEVAFAAVEVEPGRRHVVVGGLHVANYLQCTACD